MTITEANAAQAVLEHLVRSRHTLHGDAGDRVVSAGEVLAAKSYKVLGAGMSGERFVEAARKPVTR